MTDAIWAISIKGFEIDVVMSSDQRWTVSAHAIATKSACPQCQQPSERVHQYYVRTLRDLPVDGRAVELVLQVRRFKCLNPDCPQQTFAERLPNLADLHAQRTLRFTEALREIGFALNSEAGAALADALHLPTSGDTLLRVVHSTPVPTLATPRVLGVDDWAYRKGQAYGTLLIDQERHCPVDLLAGRTAAGLAQWLQTHPGVEIMTRDRSSEFLRGMSTGNPHAIQVADRWHLLHNLREALERMLNRMRQPLNRLPMLPAVVPRPEIAVLAQLTRRSVREEATKQAKREQRHARFVQVQALRQEGLHILQIAQRLKLSRGTTRSFFYADAFPERAPRRRRKSILDPYAQLLQARWEAGCHNAKQLWRDIQAHGFAGSSRAVSKWVRLRRTEPAATTPRRYRSPAGNTQSPAPVVALPAAKQLAWLLVRKVDGLTADELATLQHIQQHDLVARAYRLAQQFGQLVREHRATALDPWLTACETSAIPDLVSFTAGLRSDATAVRAALKMEWSNGQTEGQVNRLKMIKRSMYGRASFKLLRLKVLHRRC